MRTISLILIALCAIGNFLIVGQPRKRKTFVEAVGDLMLSLLIAYPLLFA